jgi:hypothetical protein
MVQFTYRITAMRKFLLIWNQGLPTREQVFGMQTEIMAAMEHHDVRRILIDTRELLPVEETLRKVMTDWLDVPGRFEAIAMLSHSNMIAVRSTMDAFSKGLPRRGFTSQNEAEAWLNHFSKVSPKKSPT